MDVTVAELMANLSNILRRAAAGTDVRITRHGKPYVRLKPDRPATPKLTRVGAFEDPKFEVPDDFDELGPEWDEYVKLMAPTSPIHIFCFGVGIVRRAFRRSMRRL